MSKIGDRPITITEGSTVTIQGKEVTVGGPLGEIKVSFPEGISVEAEGNQVRVKRLSSDRQTACMHGTIARLIQNALSGTAKGFEKVLEIVGTGYRGQMEGETLVLSLGFSHSIKFHPPEGIKISVIENKIKVFGSDKKLVGNIAYKIREYKKPDSYKGKGIRYFGEKLKLKPGKAAGKVGAAAGK